MYGGSRKVGVVRKKMQWSNMRSRDMPLCAVEMSDQKYGWRSVHPKREDAEIVKRTNEEGRNEVYSANSTRRPEFAGMHTRLYVRDAYEDVGQRQKHDDLSNHSVVGLPEGVPSCSHCRYRWDCLYDVPSRSHCGGCPSRCAQKGTHSVRSSWPLVC